MIDGAEHLDSAPLTLNAPYPTTRSGFFKVSFFVKAQPGTDFGAFFDHWLSVHAANVRRVMAQVGGFRYVISHSLVPAHEPWAGLAELYFQDASGWNAYRKTIRPDGMERWVANDGVLVLRAQTEMVGIP
ncbi:MAG: EthD domain-containing protein [Gammaproteobacteria bacterium]|nr:EthD domain-containing protein [Gammaproteobacteria bacterium]